MFGCRARIMPFRRLRAALCRKSSRCTRTVAHAQVEGHGMHGGMLTGEGPFIRSTVADAEGRFTLISSDWPSRIIATSPDSKQIGQVLLSFTQLPYVIVVR